MYNKTNKNSDIWHLIKKYFVTNKQILYRLYKTHYEIKFLNEKTDNHTQKHNTRRFLDMFYKKQRYRLAQAEQRIKLVNKALIEEKQNSMVQFSNNKLENLNKLSTYITYGEKYTIDNLNILLGNAFDYKILAQMNKSEIDIYKISADKKTRLGTLKSDNLVDTLEQLKIYLPKGFVDQEGLNVFCNLVYRNAMINEILKMSDKVFGDNKVNVSFDPATNRITFSIKDVSLISPYSVVTKNKLNQQLLDNDGNINQLYKEWSILRSKQDIEQSKNIRLGDSRIYAMIPDNLCASEVCFSVPSDNKALRLLHNFIEGAAEKSGAKLPQRSSWLNSI